MPTPGFRCARYSWRDESLGDQIISVANTRKLTDSFPILRQDTIHSSAKAVRKRHKHDVLGTAGAVVTNLPSRKGVVKIMVDTKQWSLVAPKGFSPPKRLPGSHQTNRSSSNRRKATVDTPGSAAPNGDPPKRPEIAHQAAIKSGSRRLRNPYIPQKQLYRPKSTSVGELADQSPAILRGCRRCRRQGPRLVGASAVPAEMPSGKNLDEKNVKCIFPGRRMRTGREKDVFWRG